MALKKRNRLKLLIATAWVTLSVVVLLVLPEARKGPLGFGSPAPMTTFQPKDASYIISYPANWVVFEFQDGNHGDHEVIASVLVSGRSEANVTISRKSFPSGTINDLLNWGELRASQNEDYLPLSTQPFDNRGLDGFAHIYQWSSPAISNKTLIHCQDFYILAGNNGYDLAFCSKENDWVNLEDIYVEMIQSFSVPNGAK